MSVLRKFAALARNWIPSGNTPSLPQPVPSIPATVASAAPALLGDPTPAIRISDEAIALFGAKRASVWKTPEMPPGVVPKEAKIAMDDAMAGNFGWMVQSQFSEGLEFFGFPYLAELTQRAEYRRPAEIIAKAMTMKWIKIQATGEVDKSDKIKEIEEALEQLQCKDRMQIMALHDGFFGRGQLFIDMGTSDVPGELMTRLTVDNKKIDARGIRNLQPVEAMWSYPNQYNSNDPLKKDFFKPETWFVMGTEVHHSRLLTMVSRPVPDMLKPTYAFGGLSLTQISKPYVDNWLRTRQSVSDLIHNFSVMVLSTDLGDILNMGTGQQIFNRADLFNKARDNRGVFLINKASEELTNVAVPLGTLDALQAQSQEHMAAVNGIPLIILFGITPTGLNATADPELKEFARTILASQEDFLRPPITRVIRMIQVAKWGGWDPEITFKFEPLMPEDMKELAETGKIKAETDEIMINDGVITPQEARQRVADEEDSPYAGLDTTIVPEPPAQSGEEGGGAGLPGLNEHGEPKEGQPPNPNPEAGGVKPNGAGPHPFGHDADPDPGWHDAIDYAWLGMDDGTGIWLGTDDKWITVHPHGKEVKPGQPVLISEGGEVLGGLGGKFKGQQISSVKSAKTAEATKPGQAAPIAEAPKAAEAPKKPSPFGSYSFHVPVHAILNNEGKVIGWHTSELGANKKLDKKKNDPKWAGAHIEKVTKETADNYEAAPGLWGAGGAPLPPEPASAAIEPEAVAPEPPAPEQPATPEAPVAEQVSQAPEPAPAPAPITAEPEQMALKLADPTPVEKPPDPEAITETLNKSLQEKGWSKEGVYNGIHYWTKHGAKVSFHPEKNSWRQISGKEVVKQGTGWLDLLANIPATEKPVAPKTSAPKKKTATQKTVSAEGAEYSYSPHGPVNGSSLPAALRESLTYYTGSSYQPINSALRNDMPPPPVSEHVQKLTNNILQAFASAPPVKKAFKVLRGIGKNGFFGMLKTAGLEKPDDLQPGMIIMDKAFMSTTLNPSTSWGSNAVLHISVPPGAKALYLKPISSHSSENETLLPNRSKFKVTAVDKEGEYVKRIHVEMLV
jgi:uncharacterized protein